MKTTAATTRSLTRHDNEVAAPAGAPARAKAAWRASRRRRLAHGTADAVADAAFAVGGLMIANVAFRLGVALPTGRVGVLAGIVLLAAGAAIVKIASRPKTTHRPDPATAARPVVIRLDEPEAKVIHLDAPAESEARRAA